MCVTRLCLTGASAQVFDVDLLLLHTRRLSDQTGVVVGVSVGSTDGVFIVTAAVDVTYAPEERSHVSTVSHRKNKVLSSVWSLNIFLSHRSHQH